MIFAPIDNYLFDLLSKSVGDMSGLYAEICGDSAEQDTNILEM